VEEKERKGRTGNFSASGMSRRIDIGQGVGVRRPKLRGGEAAV